MATIAQWIEGARLRTLPNAIAPVVVGSGVAMALGQFSWTLAVLTMIVALALIVGVNFANDYSDGVRGTDVNRVGPLRLVGSGVARPDAVRTAALASFGVAMVTGLAAVIISGRWAMIAVGALCIAAAWFYTGGKHPYGYAGLGELAVFVSFGLVAVLGTVYVQAGQVSGYGIGAAVAVGCFSASVLVVNNLRDIPTDTAAGKHTLAVLIGDQDTRNLYLGLIAVPFLISAVGAIHDTYLLLGFLALPLLLPGVRKVVNGATGQALVAVLRDTALAMLVWAGVTAVGLAVGGGPAS
ncbi:MAG: 1,4-dihydroxy-2-naphthoate polyprenyltransferase [Kutzneria sp.]|nr:1,4-dihydroxy-2-naphthoate polyprenyltransferase [Kutzneria sp.]MBV9845082.1 1,4-dihydroxy-2-naphthoate polyprenyltransferase [Kutzneria sp.]